MAYRYGRDAFGRGRMVRTVRNRETEHYNIFHGWSFNRAMVNNWTNGPLRGRIEYVLLSFPDGSYQMCDWNSFLNHLEDAPQHAEVQSGVKDIYWLDCDANGNPLQIRMDI